MTEKNQIKTIVDLNDVKWKEITQDIEEDFDYVIDTLTDIEIFLIKLLILKGPKSAREIWNKKCEHIYREDYPNESMDVNKEELTETQIYDEMREFISDKNHNYPSYHTIKKNLESLEDMGILVRRRVSGRKADHLWMVNPRFKKLWRNRKREIADELEEAGGEEGVYSKMRELYSNRVIDFYNLSEKAGGVNDMRYL